MKKRGMLDSVFGKGKIQVNPDSYFKLLSGYTAVYTSYEGGIYEMDLTRSAIHAIANNASKLTPQIMGTAYKNLQNILKFKPNPYMDTKNFLYRLITILQAENNAFVVPMYGADGWVSGLFPIRQSSVELLDVQGEMYARFRFPSGEQSILPYSEIGHMRKYFYKNDIFGESNMALNTTMQVLNTQQQGIINAIKSSANIRFLAKLTNTLLPKDVAAERQRLKDENLSVENDGGFLLYDNKYEKIEAINQAPAIVNPAQVKAIRENVYTYFGVNEKILTNSYDEDEWNAFYEGAIEPLAIELSLILTNMLFTEREKATGNQIIFESNRLQYASNSSKLAISTGLVDRGIMTPNQAAEIFNMAPFPGGDIRVIRKDYIELKNLGQELDNNGQE